MPTMFVILTPPPKMELPVAQAFTMVEVPGRLLAPVIRSRRGAHVDHRPQQSDPVVDAGPQRVGNSRRPACTASSVDVVGGGHPGRFASPSGQPDNRRRPPHLVGAVAYTPTSSMSAAR